MELKSYTFHILLGLLAISCYYYYNSNNQSANDSKQISQDKQNSENQTKLIVYECSSGICGGWADRLRGIMATYVFAILTDRKFKISITKPCNLEQMFDENKIKWKLDEPLESLLKNNLKPIGLQFYNGRGHLTFRDYFYTNDFHEALKNDLIIFRTNMNTMSVFKNDKVYREKIKRLGFKIEQFNLVYLFNKFYNDIFKLNAHMQKKYDYYVEKLDKKDDMKLICAQIRVGDTVFKNPAKTTPEIYKKYWSHIKEKFISKFSLSSYKIFVTSDHKGAEEDAVREFGSDRIFRIEGAQTHIGHHVHENASDCSLFEKPILDLHFLQNCDMAVVSMFSGFGIFGVLNRKNLWKICIFFRNQYSN